MEYTGRQCCSGAWVAHLNSLGLDFTHLRNGATKKYVLGHVLRNVIRPRTNNGYRVGLRQLPLFPSLCPIRPGYF